jgi:hypothetical protein
MSTMSITLEDINNALVKTFFPSNTDGVVRLYLDSPRRTQFAQHLGVTEPIAMTELYTQTHPLVKQLKNKRKLYLTFLREEQRDNEDDDVIEKNITNRIPDFLAHMVVTADAYFRGWKQGDDPIDVYWPICRRINNMLEPVVNVTRVDYSTLKSSTYGLPSCFERKQYVGLGIYKMSQWRALQIWSQKYSIAHNSPELQVLEIRRGPGGIVRTIRYMAPFLQKDERVFKIIANTKKNIEYTVSKYAIEQAIRIYAGMFSTLAQKFLESFGYGVFVNAIMAHMNDPHLEETVKSDKKTNKDANIIIDKTTPSNQPKWIFELESNVDDDTSSDSLKVGLSFEAYTSENPESIMINGIKQDLFFKDDVATYPIDDDGTEEIDLANVTYVQDKQSMTIPLSPKFWRMLVDIQGGLSVETETLQGASAIIALKGNKKALANAIGIPEWNLSDEVLTRYRIGDKNIVLYPLKHTTNLRIAAGENIKFQLEGGGRLDSTTKPTYLRDLPPMLILTEGKINRNIRIQFQELPITDLSESKVLQEMKPGLHETILLPGKTSGRVFTVERYKEYEAKNSDQIWRKEIEFIESKDLTHDTFWNNVPLMDQISEKINESGTLVSENDYNIYQKQIMSQPPIDSEAAPLKAGLTLQGWTEANQLYRDKNEKKIKNDEIKKMIDQHAKAKIDMAKRQKQRDDETARNRQNKATDTAGSQADDNTENAKETLEDFDKRKVAEIKEKVKIAPEEMKNWSNELNDDAKQLSLRLATAHYREKLEDSRKVFETEANNLVENANTLADDFNPEKGWRHYCAFYDDSQGKWDRLWKRFKRTMERLKGNDEREERRKQRESKVITASAKTAKITPRRNTLRDRLLQSLKNHPNNKDISRALYCSCTFCSRGSGLK